MSGPKQESAVRQVLGELQFTAIRKGPHRSQWIARPSRGSNAALRFGSGTNFANFLRFSAVAARRNSSRDPVGPLNRRGSSG